MNSITPINLQKISYLKNNEPHTLSEPNIAKQNANNGYVPSFRGSKAIIRNKKTPLFASITAFFTGLFVKNSVDNKNAKEETIKKFMETPEGQEWYNNFTQLADKISKQPPKYFLEGFEVTKEEYFKAMENHFGNE